MCSSQLSKRRPETLRVCDQHRHLCSRNSDSLLERSTHNVSSSEPPGQPADPLQHSHCGRLTGGCAEGGQREKGGGSPCHWIGGSTLVRRCYDVSSTASWLGLARGAAGGPCRAIGQPSGRRRGLETGRV